MGHSLPYACGLFHSRYLSGPSLDLFLNTDLEHWEEWNLIFTDYSPTYLYGYLLSDNYVKANDWTMAKSGSKCWTNIICVYVSVFIVDKRLLEHEDESTVANFRAHDSVHTRNMWSTWWSEHSRHKWLWTDLVFILVQEPTGLVNRLDAGARGKETQKTDNL